MAKCQQNVKFEFEDLEEEMIFIDACLGKKTAYTPVWMMRQAGRYLPQYRAVRQKAGDFLTLCKTPELACEVTLQPVEELGVDAAILFSDILVVPEAMGLGLGFFEGEGPKFLSTIRDLSDLDTLNVARGVENLGFVYDAVRQIRKNLDASKALIGFCGAPWTLATYVIEGGSSRTYANSKKMLYQAPQLMHSILRKITNCLKTYLDEQIRAGADAVQIFDSWAGALEASAYSEFGLSYVVEICDFVKQNHPQTPIIFFAKDANFDAKQLLKLKADVLGVDWACRMSEAKAKFGEKFVLQGNLEPARLYSVDAIDEGVEEILSVMQNRRHIFNLGHGILPDIPVANAQYFVKQVQSKSARFN